MRPYEVPWPPALLRFVRLHGLPRCSRAQPARNLTTTLTRAWIPHDAGSLLGAGCVACSRSPTMSARTRSVNNGVVGYQLIRARRNLRKGPARFVIIHLQVRETRGSSSRGGLLHGAGRDAIEAPMRASLADQPTNHPGCWRPIAIDRPRQALGTLSPPTRKFTTHSCPS